ncbi:molybdenum ABC transporter ATP-binding protein [Celeribacter arenosi]|uniref:Molybdenum ABC transporter ATP-binding protein n=1 Tax=Celeribacter arenosi TaxID=792649 RepID=A0ABP7JTZ4_9RHOB
MLTVDIRQRLGAFDLTARFDAPQGITALFGASGAGKTSVINAISGLSMPDEGRITLGDTVLFDAKSGINLPAHQRGIATVFQDARLFPHMSVARNLGYGRRYARTPLGEAEEARIIDMLGIRPLLDRRPAKLSGGERQRVALGRALFSAPRLLLADEPLAALDRDRKAGILPYFERLRDEAGLPVLYVSHSVFEVARLASQVVVLGAGRVIATGAPADVLSDPALLPDGDREAGALISARVVSHDSDGLSALDAGGVAFFLPQVPANIGVEVRVRISASDVMLARDRPLDISALNVVSGRIVGFRDGGEASVLVTLETPAGPLFARITKRSVAAMALEEGQKVFAVVKTIAIAKGDMAGD